MDRHFSKPGDREGAARPGSHGEASDDSHAENPVDEGRSPAASSGENEYRPLLGMAAVVVAGVLLFSTVQSGVVRPYAGLASSAAPVSSAFISSSPPSASSITVISRPAVKAGKSAVLSIRGTPATAYSIAVYYSSGLSSAGGLEDQVSDSDGIVTWTWRVGARTKPGVYRVVVSGGGQTVETSLTVQ